MNDIRIAFNQLPENELPSHENCVDESLQDTAKPQKKGITGSTLKIIAMVSMLMDHIAVIILTRILILRGFDAITDQHSADIFAAANSGLIFAHTVLRIFGRIAFPIFCFLLVEGFLHTRDVKKYLSRLFLFTLISEIPFDLTLTGTLFNWSYQNVYFTLSLGVLALIAIRTAEEKTEWHMTWRISFGVLITLLCAGITFLLKADYDISGVLIIAILYVLRRQRTISMGLSCAVLMKVGAFLSMIPVYFYNGKRGSNIKWLFYVFYPAHMLLLYLIAVAMGTGLISVV